MRKYKKQDIAVERVRQYLEPGPVVLVSSAYQGERDIMTMGWHMVLMDEPSLLGCFIWDQNYSRELVRQSKECVINVPEISLAETVVGIGNYHGPQPDKFDEFELTAEQGANVRAPLIAECYANFECRLVDTSQIKKHSLFVFEVVRARVTTTPKWPTTMHYRGEGMFMVAGKTTSKWRKGFRPEML